MTLITKIIGLGIGEETKGAWVEFLVQKTHAQHVWRKGGPQSGHHLVVDNKTEAMLSHFGSGVFQKVSTFVDMPIIPAELFKEAQYLEGLGIENPLSLITINASCLVVVPFYQALSRLREILRKQKKGTIGLGVGEAIKSAKQNPNLRIIAHDLKLSKKELEKKIDAVRVDLLTKALKIVSNRKFIPKNAKQELAHLQNRNIVSEIAASYNLMADLVTISYEKYYEEMLSQNTVIETSHGALLHPRHGYAPHVTQIDPTGYETIAKINALQDTKVSLKRFGVLRSYSTRFGAGPLVTESRKFLQDEPETHNKDNEWLGRFRKGCLDLVGIKYGISVCKEPKLDGLMVSFMDSLKNKDAWPVCVAYIYKGKKNNLSEFFEISDTRITSIKLRPDDHSNKHLQHQEELTKLLIDCCPVIRTIKATKNNSLEENFISFVEEFLELPIVAVAYGPKLSDRYVRPGSLSLLT